MTPKFLTIAVGWRCLVLGAVVCTARVAAQDAALVELQDGQFGRLVGVLADEIRSALNREGISSEANCRMPQVSFGWQAEASLGPRFAGQLSQALGERLKTQLRFVPGTEQPASLSCQVEFSEAADGGPVRQLRFTLRNAADLRTLLTMDFDYTPRSSATTRPSEPPAPRSAPPPAPKPAPPPVERPRPAPEARPPAPRPPAEELSPEDEAVRVEVHVRGGRDGGHRHSSRKLKLDLDPDELADRIADGIEGYDDQSIFEPTGRIIFLDDGDVKKFWITSVQAGHRENNKMRVQISMRARGERRKAQLRMIYLDGAGRPLAVSRVVEWRCPQSQTVTAVFEASDPHAAGYICLFKAD